MLLRGHHGVESTFNVSTMAVNSGSGIYPSSYLKTVPNYYGTVYLVCGVGWRGFFSRTTDILTTRCTSSVANMVVQYRCSGWSFRCKIPGHQLWNDLDISSPFRKTGTFNLHSEQAREWIWMFWLQILATIFLRILHDELDDWNTILTKSFQSKNWCDGPQRSFRFEVAETMDQPEGRNQVHRVRDANLPKGIYMLRCLVYWWWHSIEKIDHWLIKIMKRPGSGRFFGMNFISEQWLIHCIRFVHLFSL